MYKELAIVLANRLNLVIQKVIYGSQATFVQGRKNLDGLSSQMRLWMMQRNKKEKSLFCSMLILRMFMILLLGWEYLRFSSI